MTGRAPRPPRIASWLLRVRPLGDRRHDVAADLLELFQARVESQGLRYARRRYYHDVLSLWFARAPIAQPQRHQSRAGWRDGGLQDLKFAGRLFMRYRASTSIAVAGLAVSLALCGVVFSILNAVAFRSPGVADAASVVNVFQSHENDLTNTLPYEDFENLQRAATRISLTAYVQEPGRLADRPQSEVSQPAHVDYVTRNFFSVLGGRAERGRTLENTDHASSPVAVVSHAYWQRRLSGAEDVVGRTIWLNGTAFTIVGVADKAFTGPSGHAPAFWAPMTVYLQARRGAGSMAGEGRLSVQVVGRMVPGGDVPPAAEELTRLIRATTSNRRAADASYGVRLVPIGERQRGPDDGDVVTAIALTISVVALALFLACANVANLLLATAAAREREMSVRLALGASRTRLVRQLLTESVLLSLTSGAIGLLLITWFLPAFANLVELPPTIDPSPGLAGVAFLAIISLAAGLGTGAAPALRTARAALQRPADANVIGLRGGRRLRSSLLGVQTAVSLVVLIVAMLMGKAAVRAATVDPGFSADRLITITPAFSRGRYGNAELDTFWNIARSRIAALPGVEGVSLALFPPYSGGSWVQVTRREGVRRTIFFNEVTPEYFQTIGVRLLAGRSFSDDESRSGAAVAVISHRLVVDNWPDGQAIGSTLDRVHSDLTGVRVIGIVSDAYLARLREYQASAIYRPVKPQSMAGVQLVVRATEPAATVRAAVDVVSALDSTLRPTAMLIADGLAVERREPATVALMAGLVASVALALSFVGLVGATLQQVRQRMSEIALRLAIGATSGDVLRWLLRDCLRPVAVGILAGVVVAWLGGNTIASVVFGVSPTDPASIARAVLVLVIAAFAAVFVPTRRAARTDPSRILRDA